MFIGLHSISYQFITNILELNQISLDVKTTITVYNKISKLLIIPDHVVSNALDIKLVNLEMYLNIFYFKYKSGNSALRIKIVIKIH